MHLHFLVFILSEELCQSCNFSHRQINAFPFNSSFSYSNIQYNHMNITNYCDILLPKISHLIIISILIMIHNRKILRNLTNNIFNVTTLHKALLISSKTFTDEKNPLTIHKMKWKLNPKITNPLLYICNPSQKHSTIIYKWAPVTEYEKLSAMYIIKRSLLST